MGTQNIPDIFQNIKQEILGNCEFPRVYLDDTLITSSGTYEQHLYKVNQVLQCLPTAGFNVNLKKSCFIARELD
jgi:hypothetical protein